MIVDFPDRFEDLVHRAEIIYQETMERLLQEGGSELVAAFQCVGLINWINLHDSPTQAMLEFAARVEAIVGPVPVLVCEVGPVQFNPATKGWALAAYEGILMQDLPKAS